MPAFASAPAMAIDPSLVALTEANEPPNDPRGVRTALTITASRGLGADDDTKRPTQAAANLRESPERCIQILQILT